MSNSFVIVEQLFLLVVGTGTAPILTFVFYQFRIQRIALEISASEEHNICLVLWGEQAAAQWVWGNFLITATAVLSVSAS